MLWSPAARYVTQVTIIISSHYNNYVDLRITFSGYRHAADPSFWDPRGTQNQVKNVMKIRCSKRGPQSALWKPMGRLGEPQGHQMMPRREPKGNQKQVL